LSYEVTEEDLRLALEQFGQVESATIIKDKHSGQSKGFGFVEMASKAEGQSAIDGLNGKELKGRALKVLLHFRLRGCAHIDHRHAADQFGQPFLQFFTIVVGGGLIDLSIFSASVTKYGDRYPRSNCIP